MNKVSNYLKFVAIDFLNVNKDCTDESHVTWCSTLQYVIVHHFFNHTCLVSTAKI